MTIPTDTPRSLGDRDAPHLSPVTPEEDARTVLLNRISWGAVLAGVVVGLVVQLILNMIGVGIGAATFHPMTGDNPDASAFSIGPVELPIAFRRAQDAAYRDCQTSFDRFISEES